MNVPCSIPAAVREHAGRRPWPHRQTSVNVQQQRARQRAEAHSCTMRRDARTWQRLGGRTKGGAKPVSARPERRV